MEPDRISRIRDQLVEAGAHIWAAFAAARDYELRGSTPVSVADDGGVLMRSPAGRMWKHRGPYIVNDETVTE